ncbi:MAG: hypothetical protein ACTSUF_10875 [Candidatus Heimdallarchaeaceae archaeon]
MSEFDLPWNKFVGFCMFTLDEDLIYDKVINLRSSYSTVYHLIDTSAKIRKELQTSKSATIINDVFRVDYNLFYNHILACMFDTDISDESAQQIIKVVKDKLIEQLADYGAIEKMEPAAQAALVKKLGNLISERAANQIRYDFYSAKRTAPAKAEVTPVEEARPTQVSSTPSKPISTAKEVRPTSAPSEPEPRVSSKLGGVEELLDFIGLKQETKPKEETGIKKQEMTKQLLEETKRESIKRILSSVIKGLSPKTGVCYVAKFEDGKLDLTAFGMSEKHANFVLGILSKYPEIVKQILESDAEEKTLDAGDGVVILEDTETGVIVGITAKREEISIMAKRMKLIKTMINEFLKSAF